MRIETWDVRLYVKQRRTIQDIKFVQMEGRSLTSEQTDDAEPDRVRPIGCARRKHTARDIVQKRGDDQSRRARLVKMVEEVDVGKSVGSVSPQKSHADCG